MSIYIKRSSFGFFFFFLRINLQLNTKAERFEMTEADAEELGVVYPQIVRGMLKGSAHIHCFLNTWHEGAILTQTQI